MNKTELSPRSLEQSLEKCRGILAASPELLDELGSKIEEKAVFHLLSGDLSCDAYLQHENSILSNLNHGEATEKSIAFANALCDLADIIWERQSDELPSVKELFSMPQTTNNLTHCNQP